MSIKKMSHVVSSLQIGGAERFVIDLCVEQRAKGMSPEIVSLGQYSDPLLKVAIDLGLKVTVISGIKGILQFRLWKALRPQTLIHIHSPTALMVLLPIMPFFLIKKIVYTRHGAGKLASKRWRKVHQFARRYVDSVCFVSEEGQNIFHQVHGWEHVDSSVIDNGIAMPEEQDVEPILFDNRLRIGSVGRMIRLKRQICLLKAIRVLPKELQARIEVHFFGNGDELSSLQLFTKQHLSAAEVMFHGVVSDRAQIYNRFDLLAVTSETEGMSLAIMEAMAYKRAVVATNVGGNPVLVGENRNGWLIDFDDEKALAEVIKQALSDSARLQHLGGNGRARILKEFSLQRTQLQYQKVYQEIGMSA